MLLVGGGALMVTTGRALLARRRAAAGQRPSGSAVVNLVRAAVRHGLGIYTLWTLLNDDARRAFGRRPRGPRRRVPSIDGRVIVH